METQQQANKTYSDLDGLHREYVRAFSLWLVLYTVPDCLTDPLKRLAMIVARRKYQDAALDYLWRKLR